MGTGAAVLAPLLGRVALAQDAPPYCGVSVARLTPDPQISVSLKRLSEVIVSNSIGSPDCAGANLLYGMTRLDGYALDPPNRDIVLWGLVEPDTPPLVLQDFVVALRGAAARDPRLAVRDRQAYLTAANPTISIDPDPAVFLRLSELRITEEIERRRFAEICASPQTVAVYGMPRDCRIARTLVAADYRMKMVGQGLVSLPLDPPLLGDFDLTLQRSFGALLRGEPGPQGSHNRFWFNAGEFSSTISPTGSAFVYRAQVWLSTEAQLFDSIEGDFLDGGDVDIDAESFVCSWTERMDETYEAEPIWREMHNVYRHVAIADLLIDQNALRFVDFDAGVLLERSTWDPIGVPDTLPGLHRIEINEVLRGLINYSSVCGGVSVNVRDVMKAQPDSGETRSAGELVLSRRPQPTSVAWLTNGTELGEACAPTEEKSPEPGPNLGPDNPVERRRLPGTAP